MKHLKGLDTLRAIAALIVVWSHIELLKPKFNIANSNFVFFPDAHLSVTLFFALSGFLITYLLIKERDTKNNISFKYFYIRRVLRIWPLYYLILFLSYFLVSTNVTAKTIAFAAFVFPNFPLAFKQSWSGSPHIWSIGVEEQFYMFWPLLVSLIPEKRFVNTVLSLVILYLIAPYIINFININTIHNENIYSFVQKFFAYTRFDNMAIGGIFGFLYAKKKSCLAMFSNKKLPAIFYSALPFACWFLGIKFGALTDVVYALLFTFAIIALVDNPFFNIDTKLSKFLGKISYGIYMYHWIIIFLVFGFVS